nr:hypothetical protein CFP56_26177 [Quercus suber]
MEAAPKEHIEEIRRTKFSIGGDHNPLIEDLHQAVKNLSAELYAKDVHFLMELIQNAEDNDYLEGVDPSLEFVITSEDITATGAPATLLIFNNEKGFSSKNIDSICSVGRSTKKGNRKHGYIGEKGIGFKSVFLKLSNVHPEVLLFLSKIRQLSVRERSKDPKLNTGKGPHGECRYYMWKQRFPVKQENKVERRMEVEEWVITLTFPFEERLHRGMSSIGIYAFLPTEMVTNFPFIIQADFLLASSRETILLDNKWNQGILDCVASAIINAFVSLVKTSENAPISSLAPMFGFIPINGSSYQQLNVVMESIKSKLLEESILPSESYTQQKIIHQPREVARLIPSFWTILEKARKQGVNLVHLSSHGRYILSSSLDRTEYEHIFLGVELANNEWYAKCIQSSKLVEGVSEDTYLELLLFIANNWRSKFHHTKIKDIPLIKYVGLYGDLSLCSINESVQLNCDRVVALSRHSEHISWLIDWNKEFKFHLNNCLNSFQKCAIGFVHFLYHSLQKSYLSQWEVGVLCNSMPLLDNYGNLNRQRNGVLVPANGSKWAGLIGSNPWTDEGYVELSEDYLHAGCSAGESASGEQLLEFLKTYVEASDIPYISPPNAAIPTVSSPLTKKNAFLLLGWIRDLKRREIIIPLKFLKCIKEGCWLKITTSGCPGYRPPMQSFLLSASLGNILQNGSVLVDIPLVDLSFYGDEINEYKEELKEIGVISEYGEACEFIGEHLMSFTEYSTLSRDQVLSVLNFIRFLREKFLPQDKFINSIKDKRWLRTCCGDRSPVEAVLFDDDWKTASQISSIPFIDQDYFGEEILSFREELKSLGVLIGFSDHYKLVVDNLKSASQLTSLTVEAVLLILECMHRVGSFKKLTKALRGVKCFKTNLGYKTPGECFLFDPQWVCILQVFEGFALIDHDFHGSSIFSYRNELKRKGVKVNFEAAVKVFTNRFKQQASYMTKENVLSFLSCYRQLNNTPYMFPSDLMICIRDLWWLRTRHGVKNPLNCILFGPDWQSILPITDLPFIDDSDNCYGKVIHEYKEELNSMGVIVEFKDGAKFVVEGICSPSDSTSITPATVFSLLECIRILMQARNYFSPIALSIRISKKWLKTTIGYRKGYPLIASHLDFHVQLPTIVRIYNYLSKCGWKPDSEVAKRIWIPNLNQIGEWVITEECVLHDKDGLFSSQLKVLDKYLETELLDFFSNAFGVGEYPSVDKYCNLWKVWESSGHRLSHADCCVQTISESVKKEETSSVDVAQLNQVNPKEILIAKGLVMLILGFLANPVMKMGAKKRHETIQGLLNITFLETVEPITVNYSLSLSSGEIVNARASKIIHLNRKASMFFAQKLDRSSGYKNLIEYATYFSEAISEGVLWEKNDHVGALSELIKLAFMLEFNEEAVIFLMKPKNLQIIKKDKKFLASAFPSD